MSDNTFTLDSTTIEFEAGDTIMDAARSGNKGAFGDGKIFVTDVEDVYTISSRVKEDAAVEAVAA